MQTQRFHVPPNESVHIDHEISQLDLNYIQTGNSIGLGYVFSCGLSIERLKTSLAQLLSELPALAGRLDLKARRVKNVAFVPVEHVTGFIGAAIDFTAPDKNIINRTDFVPEPNRRDILKGTAPLMCVKLTEFTNGGSILGVTINHGLMDAAGFHLVMRRWSDLFIGRDSEPLILQGDIYGFQTSRARRERQVAIRKAGMAKPLNGNTFIGRYFTHLMYKMLDGIRLRGREMIHFSAEDVANLKDRVRKESGLDWISANVAISAHVLHVIIPRQMTKKNRVLRVGNVINIRGRVPSEVCADQSNYLGNALYIMVSGTEAATSVHDFTRGDIARFLRKTFDDLKPDHIQFAMQNIVDSLEDGFGYPGLNIFKPIMAVNNQSKFDVYNVDFGAGRPLRVIPQDVGDHIMISPSPDGGVEVYIRDFVSLKRQKKLLEPEWQARLSAL